MRDEVKLMKEADEEKEKGENEDNENGEEEEKEQEQDEEVDEEEGEEEEEEEEAEEENEKEKKSEEKGEEMENQRGQASKGEELRNGKSLGSHVDQEDAGGHQGREEQRLCLTTMARDAQQLLIGLPTPARTRASRIGTRGRGNVAEEGHDTMEGKARGEKCQPQSVSDDATGTLVNQQPFHRTGVTHFTQSRADGPIIGPPTSFQRMPRDLKTGRRVCFYFNSTLCAAGATCAFLHVK
ncbi:zinc ccch-type, partial [Nannochloropsis oceanica]